jgi:sec-independent protein translocase protein TatA
MIFIVGRDGWRSPPSRKKPPWKMLSAPDIAILGAVALLVFGPEQLPRVARKFGMIMRDVQNTSQQFIREMERAADEYEPERPHLEAVPSAYSQPAGGPAAASEAGLGDDGSSDGGLDEPMLPGIEPEPVLAAAPSPPKKTAEPSEF